MSKLEYAVFAAENYFQFVYDPTSKVFEEIFHEDCKIQGMRGGRLEILSSSEYKKLVAGRASPASRQSPRDEGVLSLINIAADLAAATVRVRIGDTIFIDHLVFHAIDGRWLITSKTFHVAQSV
jgi:hypothetical protein